MAPIPITQQIAAQNAANAAAPPPSATANIFTSAFVTAPGPKKAMQATEDANATNASKIYNLSHADRQLLAKGAKVNIVSSSDEFVTMPVALFRALSTKKELVAVDP